MTTRPPCDSSACIRVSPCTRDPGLTHIKSTQTREGMHATREEWATFVEHVKAGVFDGIWL